MKIMNTKKNIKIIYTEDYKITNKKQLIKDLYIAFTSQNVEFILDHVENDIHWKISDSNSILGKEMFAKRLKQMTKLRIKTLHIKNIIINGLTCAVNGIANSVDHKNYSFCDIYHFSNVGENPKIQIISTYINNLSIEFTDVCYN